MTTSLRARRGSEPRLAKADFRLLGPLRVGADGVDVPVRRGKQRAVLAVLLLNTGRVVSAERLVDALWGESPPVSAEVAVRNYVMRLRRDLGVLQSRIRTRSPGYVIDADSGEFDVSRFESLLESARVSGESGTWELAAGQAAEALALWRGDPLSDVESDLLAQREVPRLTELRMRAVETRVEADLRLGRHAEVIGELEHLSAEYPLRENLRGQLMLALYRSGRQAEALGVYQRARRELVDELGVEPGAALRDLHQRMLCGDSGLGVPVADAAIMMAPATGAGAGAVTAARAGPETARLDAACSGTPAAVATAVPRQLPWVTSRFVGRERELGVLSESLDRAGDQPPGSVAISVISGTAGVGKTTLAVRWAHQVSGRFPDGQLYANLRGYDPGQPAETGDVLAGFLQALGLPGERIPDGTEARAAGFRSLLSGRRVLIVLDNAREAEQVRPLLPGSSSCLAVVTSRDALAGLVVRDGAVRVNLDLLPADDAVPLLAGLIGDRAAADAEATVRLAECCGRLPLALRVAAELANSRPGISLTELADELADRQRRLNLLDAGGDVRSAVREVFSWSYRNLDAATARIFRLVGLHPGPDFDSYAAAALAGGDLADARASLGRLARAHLIQPVADGRYGLHDLLRDYARELDVGQDSAEQRRAAVTGLFDYYMYAAGTATTTLSLLEQPRYEPVRSQPADTAPVLTDAAMASAWLRAERASLVAAAVHAADQGWPGHAIALSTVLYPYLDLTFYPADSRAVHSAAHRAARASRDRNGEAHALNNLAGIDWRLGRFRSGTGYLDQALAVFRETGDLGGEARTLNNLGAMTMHLGRFRQAIAYLHQALDLCRQTGDRPGEARVLHNLSFASGRSGRLEEAMDHARKSLALGRELGNPDREAYGLNVLGVAYLYAGRYQEAIDCFRPALEVFRRIGDRPGEAEMLVALAAADCRAGRPGRAIGNVWQGLALSREIGDWIYEAWALNIAGDVLYAAGQPEQARIQHAAGLELSDRIGVPYEQARARHGLGRAYFDSGDSAQARSLWEQALALYTDMEAPGADDVRALLAGIPVSVPGPPFDSGVPSG